ncbi:DUF551 domain-containing protein [Escherichia coli]|nr:DUF551 domain-containing protein [Escherichia coli]EJE0719458.1 DUF551 domain-containing protein [Escherichia coli]EJE3329617.1 DUF551 domain-containing protein [Escherichia coli]
MTTLTDKELIKEIKERIGSLDVRDNIERRAYEIALASLEAEPVAKIIAHYPLGIDVGKQKFVQAIGELPDFGGHLFAAPPVPVVPEEKPMPNPLSMYAVDAVAAIAEVRGWNACRAAMLQSGNFRENKNSSTNNFREIAETSTNYPVIPSEVLSAILKVAKIRADFDDFDGDRRGIGDCLDEAEQELIVTINKYASQLAAEPIAPNDVREQTAIPQVPVTPDGWISCSDRMPVIGELNWRTSFPLLVTCEIGVIPAYYGFVRVNGNKHYGFMESLKYGDDSGNHPQTNEYDLISNATHWMPLPEPPQEVK